MICFGVTDALCSFGLGKLSQYTGRPVLMFGGALVNLSLIIALLLWQPNRDQLAVYYVTAAGWGFCDAIWQTQVNGECARDIGDQSVMCSDQMNLHGVFTDLTGLLLL